MGTIAYGNTPAILSYLYTASSGGTVFSANRNNTAAFDYFSDSAVANDAIYFGMNRDLFADITLNVGTALSGTDVVLAWEYWNGSAWVACTDLTDNSAGFTVTGAVTVVVPWQRSWRYNTVNGQSANWIRCRIVSLTAISEGGANSTATVKKHDGVVYVTDYTDGTPCTFTEIYNWMAANHPECNCTKVANVFTFPQCGLYLNSRTFSTQEVIILGDDQVRTSGDPPKYYLYYLTCGYRSGDVGYGGSTIVYNGYGVTTNALFVNANTKMYGSTFMSAPGRLHYQSCTGGEHVNTNFISRGPSQFSAGTYINCMFQGLGILSTSIAATFQNCSFVNSSNIAHLYNAGFTLRDPVWSAAYFFYLYQTYQDPVFNLVNPNPAPAGTGSIDEFVRLPVNSTADFVKAFKYDASTGIYTDITIEVTDASADDIELDGDVDDCFYLCRHASTTQSYPITLIITADSTNDYEYVFEQYMSGAWRSYSVIADSSDNFQQDGERWHKNASYQTLQSTTINGVAGFWCRLRIATKGIEYPTASRIRFRQQQGSSDWQINEQYQIDLAVKDKAGVAIEGATVTIYDNTGAVIASESTDANGDIAQQELTVGRYTLDPINYVAGDGYIIKTSFNPLTIKVTAAGYETYRDVISVSAKTALEIALRQSATPGRDEMGEDFR